MLSWSRGLRRLRMNRTLGCNFQWKLLEPCSQRFLTRSAACHHMKLAAFHSSTKRRQSQLGRASFSSQIWKEDFEVLCLCARCRGYDTPAPLPKFVLGSFLFHFLASICLLKTNPGFRPSAAQLPRAPGLRFQKWTDPPVLVWICSLLADPEPRLHSNNANKATCLLADSDLWNLLTLLLPISSFISTRFLLEVYFSTSIFDWSSANAHSDRIVCWE